MDPWLRFGGGADYEYIVLGAGPAGLQMGHHLARAGRSYVILEGGPSPGSFFRAFPRHRTLISVNKIHTGSDDPEFNLRHDWNSILSDEGDGPRFKDYTRRFFPPADEMVRYLEDYARFHRLHIRCNTRIVRIEKHGHFRLVDAEGNSLTCRRLIVATGVSKPWSPNVPGIELADNYTEVSVDKEDFTNQRVLILGKGNSAFETADHLTETAAIVHVASPNPLQLAWKTHFVGHLRAVNNNFLDTYQLKSQNAILDCSVERIEKRDGQLHVSVRYSHAHGEAEVLIYDRVIVCTGFRFDASIFAPECRPQLTINGRFPSQTSEWESTNVPGLYFAGTLTQANDYKKTTSGFIHGFRYNVRALHRMLERKYHGRDWPVRWVEPTPDDLVEAVIGRLNSSSALWQQFGYLQDVIVVSDDWDHAEYYEEMPLAYVQENLLARHRTYFTISLEFGKITGDPFSIVRNPTPERADESVFLHPVIRRWRGTELVAEQHLLEELYGEWKKPEVHDAPLRAFFRDQLLAGDEEERTAEHLLLRMAG